MTKLPNQIQCPPIQASTPDFTAIKARQQVTWSSGDYAAVGVVVQVASESLCEAVDLHAGSRVLDVATGSGNTALAAARRYADVIGADYVPSLLQRGRERAAAERLTVDFRHGDCEALPFGDAEFDCVLSTFGAMFAPNHVATANELLRVCKRGGKIGLSHWTPEGLIGHMFKIVARYAPPPAGVASSLAWGTEDHVRELLGAGTASIRMQRLQCVFRYRSLEHWLDVFRTSYGPTLKAFESLAPAKQDELARELVELMRSRNQSGDSSLVVPSEYMEIVAVRA